MRRVGMGETNVNNTHNFIHKSSFPKHGLTRLGGFFHFRLFLSKRCCLCAKKDVPLQYLNLKHKIAYYFESEEDLHQSDQVLLNIIYES